MNADKDPLPSQSVARPVLCCMDQRHGKLRLLVVRTLSMHLRRPHAVNLIVHVVMHLHESIVLLINQTILEFRQGFLEYFEVELLAAQFLLRYNFQLNI